MKRSGLAATAMLVLGAGLSAPTLVGATPPPKPVADMIDAAAGDPAALKAVVDAAKKTNPDSAAEIDAQVAALAKRAEEEKTAKLASQTFFEGWTGSGELGGSITTGNTKDRGIAAGLGFAKETLRWRHAFTFAADYQETDDEVTKERYFAGYNGRYKFSERFYATGVLSAEKDKFAGFKSRFTEGLGLGYRVVDTETVKLDLEAGPALRQTDYYDIGSDNELTGRVAGDFKWIITPGTEFSQTAEALIGDSTTVTAISAITTKLRGALSARASFEVRYDSDPPPDHEDTDTTTRVTLVYSFP